MKKTHPERSRNSCQQALLNSLRLLQLAELIQQHTVVSVVNDHVGRIRDLTPETGFVGVDLITPQLVSFLELGLAG